MRPKWPKLASLAQKNVHSSFSSLMHSLLAKDNLLEHLFIFSKENFAYHKRQIMQKKLRLSSP